MSFYIKTVINDIIRHHQVALEGRKMTAGVRIGGAIAALLVLAAWQLIGDESRGVGSVVLKGVGQQHVRLAAATKGRALNKHSKFGARAPGSGPGQAIFARLRAAVSKHFVSKKTPTSRLSIVEDMVNNTNATDNTPHWEPIPEVPSDSRQPDKAAKGEEGKEVEEGKDDEEEEEEKPPQTVYVYDGREVKTSAAELTTFILAAGFAIPDVRYIKSSSDADIRSATWDDDCRTIIFPPVHSIPDFGPSAVKDLRAFVSRGTNESGTLLFLGGSVQVHTINELFGFELQQDYKQGPYYRNERGTMNTILSRLPKRVNELGNTQNLGLLKSSMPPETSDYYSSFGDSVASCTRVDLGRVCYLAQDFAPLQDLPELQERLTGDHEGASKRAEWDLQILGRKTDTWLAIFQAMLENPYSATY